MRKLSCISYLMIFLSPVIILNSCEKNEDYSNLIYKNYLTYEINRATTVLSKAVEGNAEGEFLPGSKQAYQGVVDDAKLIDESATSTQEDIDNAYANLLLADEIFLDQMVPFRNKIINRAARF